MAGALFSCTALVLIILMNSVPAFAVCSNIIRSFLLIWWGKVLEGTCTRQIQRKSKRWKMSESQNSVWVASEYLQVVTFTFSLVFPVLQGDLSTTSFTSQRNCLVVNSVRLLNSDMIKYLQYTYSWVFNISAAEVLLSWRIAGTS